MRKLNIALLAGGDSSEREVSLRSAAEVEAALDRSKYNVFKIDVSRNKWICHTDRNQCRVNLNDFSLNLGGEDIRLDYALIMIHGTPGEDGLIQGYLEMIGVPFSSCSAAASFLTFDKQACKRAVAAAGVNVAHGRLIGRENVPSAAELVKELGLPMFIKPNASGSSCGVTKVFTEEQVGAALQMAFGESDQVLAEELLEGREISCGILRASGREYLFPVTEIISKKDFFDYEAKYTKGMSEEITPADIDEGTLKRLNELTRTAYHACNCRGVVRIDFMVSEDGTPFMIEINSVPGMSSGSIIPQQAASASMSLGELYDLIISDTFFVRA